MQTNGSSVCAVSRVMAFAVLGPVRRYAAVVPIVTGLVALSGNANAAPNYTALILPTPPGVGAPVAYGASGGSAVGCSSLGAALWSGAAHNFLNLNGGNCAYDISGSSIVGSASGTSGDHAVFWNDPASSPVDLHPAGFSQSEAVGVSGGNQVGSGQYGPPSGPQYEHALLWHGTAASVLDLNPAGFSNSEVRAVAGNSQAGLGWTGSQFFVHALLWHGTPESVVDLNPAGFTFSNANGVWGDTQVGNGNDGSFSGSHAMLWHGTAASFVDLNPAGFSQSSAIGVWEGNQVGQGDTVSSNQTHALLWSGTAASALDLHQFLSGLGHDFVYSQAMGIDEYGNIVGDASDGTNYYAVMWSPVAPEPSVLLLAVLGGLTAMQRRHGGAA